MRFNEASRKRKKQEGGGRNGSSGGRGAGGGNGGGSSDGCWEGLRQENEKTGAFYMDHFQNPKDPWNRNETIQTLYDSESSSPELQK